MNFLLLDTADSHGCVALCRDSAVASVTLHTLADPDYSTWLLPAVHTLLREAGLSLANLDAYAVTSGPGSFTGLRIGLTSAKAWAEVFRKPIAAVSRLQAFAARRSEGQEDGSYVAAYLDAQRDQVFAALFREDGTTEVQPETVISLSSFVESVSEVCGSNKVLWRTPDPGLLKAVTGWLARQSAGDIVERIAPPFAESLCALAHQKLLRGDVTDALTLDANYVRRSDAEIFWKGNPSAAKA
jgi:tRNA threonylcarbamoyladenosine biosynthesis protein TsaB